MAISNKTKIAVNSALTTVRETQSNLFENKQYCISSEGKQRTIKKATKAPQSSPAYAVSFSDGSKINVTGDTLFKLSTASERLLEEDGDYDSHYIDIPHIIETSEEEWAYPLETVYKGKQNDNTALLPPYVLGLWAAGIIRENNITANLHPECHEELEDRGFHLYPILGEYDITSFMLNKNLAEVGVSNHSIPSSYLFAPIEDRIDLLKGITAHSNKSHRATITLITENINLISNIRTLLASLGASSRIRLSHRAEHTSYFTIAFQKNFDDMKKDLEWNRIHKIEKIPNDGHFLDLSVSNKHKDIAIGETFIPILTK